MNEWMNEWIVNGTMVILHYTIHYHNHHHFMIPFITRITALSMEVALPRLPAPLLLRTSLPPFPESNNTLSVHLLTLWMRSLPLWPKTAVWNSWRKCLTWRRNRWRKRTLVWVWIAWRWEPMTWRMCVWLRRWLASNSNYSLPHSCAEWCWRLMMWLHRAIYNEFGVSYLL